MTKSDLFQLKPFVFLSSGYKQSSCYIVTDQICYGVYRIRSVNAPWCEEYINPDNYYLYERKQPINNPKVTS